MAQAALKSFGIYTRYIEEGEKCNEMKKILGLVLAAAMVLTLLPATAFAATSSAGTASELASAITGASTGDTVQLTADITGIEEMQIDKAITIDMNGFSISGNPSSRTAFKVVAGGNLTLANTSGTLSKLLVGTGEGDEYNYEGIRINGSGIATVKANVSIETGLPVFIKGNGTAGSAQLDVYGKLAVSACLPSGDAYAAIQGNGTAGNGGTVININSGAEIINPYSSAMYIPQDGVINVYGGTITGKSSAIALKSGTLNISGGTLKATGPANIPTTGWSSGVNASGCAIQIESNDAYSGNIVVNITGGTIVSDHGYALYEYLDSGNTDTEVTSINVENATLQSAASSGTMISQELDAVSGSRITIASSVVSLTSSASEVTADADITYMIVITPSVDFGTISRDMSTQTKNFVVAVEDALIEAGASISVENATTDMTMKDKNGAGSETLAFTLEQSNGLFTFTQADLADGEHTINSSVICDPSGLRAAGSYKGYMMFTVSYVTP